MGRSSMLIDQEIVRDAGGPDLAPREFWRGPWEPEPYPMLCNSVSGPEIGLPGRRSVGFYSGNLQNWFAGRPEAGRGADFDVLPMSIWPKSGPETPFPARNHYRQVSVN